MHYMNNVQFGVVSKKIMNIERSVLVLLLFVSLCEASPRTDVVTSSDGKHINVTLIELRSKGPRFTNYAIAQSNSVLTSLVPLNGPGLQFFLFSLDSDHRIWRSKVEVRSGSIKVEPFQRLALKTSPYGALMMQTTHFRQPQVLATFTYKGDPDYTDQFRLVQLGTTGFLGRRSGNCFPTYDQSSPFSAGGLSADGKVCWNTASADPPFDYDGVIFYQLQWIHRPFEPTRESKFVDMGKSFISSGDISSNVPGKPRIFVYRQAKLFVNTSTESLYKSRIAVQRISSSTLKFVGKPFAITDFRVRTDYGPEDFQSIAVDPASRYVIYTVFSRECGKSILKLLQLDKDFQPAGSPKTILGCRALSDSKEGLFGLDVMKDPRYWR
jgi:hypothetical protein